MTASELTELAARVEAGRKWRAERAEVVRYGRLLADVLKYRKDSATPRALAAQQQDRQTEGENSNG